MATVHSLKPSLTQARGLSDWQKVVNQAGYAPSKTDIRASTITEHKYVHTNSKSLLNATQARNAKLKGASHQEVADHLGIDPARGTVKNVQVEVETRQETLRKLKHDFITHYSAELEHLTREIPARFWKQDDQSMESFDLQVRGKLDQMTQVYFPKAQQANAQSVRDTILKATIEAEKYLLDLRNQFSDDLDKAPQLFENNGKVTVIRIAPPPENLALRGGGTKGIGYIGEVRALETQGVIKKLRHVAGTSAGALTASLIAGGLSADKFAQVSRSRSPMEMARRKDKDVDLQLNTGLFSASAVVSLVDGAIKESMRDFLGANPPPDLSALTPQEQQQLRDLAKAPISTPVRFRHLQLLATVEPQRFKNLTLAVFDATERRTKHIEANSHPDWPIGETARMSMAIPVVFKSVQGPDGHTYQDGGLGSNMPSEAFVRPDVETVPKTLTRAADGTSAWTPDMQAHLDGLIASAGGGPAPTEAQQADTAAKTLLISFDEGGKFHQIVNQGKLFSNPGALKAAFGASSNVTANDRLKIYSAGPNAMAAFHGTLDTQSFSASQRKLDLVELFSEAKALEQVRQQVPMDRATYEVQDNLDAALQTLTTDELNLLHEACNDRIAGDREIEEGNPSREVPDLKLLKAIENEQALRSPEAPMSERQIRAVQGLRETAQSVRAELSAAQLLSNPDLQTPRQEQLLSADTRGPKALQELILREHLVKALDSGAQGLQPEGLGPVPDPVQGPEPNGQDANEAGQVPIDNQGQQAIDLLNETIALLKDPASAAHLDADTLTTWCESASGLNRAPSPAAWVELANQIKAQLPVEQPEAQQDQRQSLPVSLQPRLTMPRLIGYGESVSIEPRQAILRAQQGVEAADRAGVKSSSSWFARIAKVTAGVLGMAGAVALGILFPPAAPLIYVGSLAVTAGIARALQGGQSNQRNQRALDDELQQQRLAAQRHNRA